MKEIRKDIKWYEWLYQVSNLWRVRSLDHYTLQKNKRWWYSKVFHKWKILNPRNKKNKSNVIYKVVTLNKQKRKNFYVHRLVAEYFIWKIKKWFEVAHIDWNPHNNIISNLKICTHKENEKDKIIHWTITIWERSWTCKYTEKKIINLFINIIKKNYFVYKNLHKKHKIKKEINKYIKINDEYIHCILNWYTRKYIYKEFLPIIKLQKEWNLFNNKQKILLEKVIKKFS